ncbi:MAG: diguanylate cyclase [Acidobacteriia bacterium]|nr:diguanylate cyclase [Terriglobia bacterium]
MSATFFDHPELYRSVLESLPLGIYILDRQRRVRFWNQGAEHLTGHLAHEAMGQDGTGHLVQPCDSKGRVLSGDDCPVTATLTHGHDQQFEAFYLHKNGHRIAVRGRTRAILEHNDAVVGAIVAFEEAFVSREDSPETPMYGCLDPTTGVPSHRLTRAMLTECMADMERSQQGFSVLRLRVLGLDEFRSTHGIQSAIPFLRTAAHTLRQSLDPENFLGRWGEDEFMAVLPSASPVLASAAAEMVWSLVTNPEISWWGDRFPVKAVVSYTVAWPGDSLEKLLNSLEPAHAAAQGRAVGAGNNGAHSEHTRG